MVSKQRPVIHITQFLLQTFCISCCLITLVSARICTTNLQQQESWESFPQSLLCGLHAHVLASRCYHSPGTDLPLSVAFETLVVNPIARRLQARQFLQLKDTEKQLLLVWFITNSMEQSPSWKADQSLQLVKKFSAFLWNQKVFYPYSQVPATRPYPEPTPSSSYEPLQLPEDPS
jgi:hypothetical protein